MFDLLKKKLADFASSLTKKNDSVATTIETPARQSDVPSSPEPLERTQSTPADASPTIPQPAPVSGNETKRAIKPATGIVEALQGRLTGKITLSSAKLEPALEELELALLEADVDLDAAAKIRDRLRDKLENKPLETHGKTTAHAIERVIRQTLLELLDVPSIDLVERIRQKNEPFVVLFTGPNGAGKTTSMAKLTHTLMHQHALSVVWSASDTFRAASIEQLEVHAKRLNVRLVKHAYGSDPAAVAFDAIAAAKANQNNVVLLDSAGRQETNSNLMNELEKLKRVAKPDLVVFVGESYAGQSLLDMAREFNDKLGLDGLILTKLDADPKGGTILSLVIELKKPVLFIGTGQEYDDFEAFDAHQLVDRII